MVSSNGAGGRLAGKAAIIVAIAAGTAAAADAEPADRLDPVVVEGRAVDAEYDPGHSSLMSRTTTRDTFEDRQVDSLSDYARRLDAGINVSEANDSIEIRGLDRNRVLTTIDGIRVPWLGDGARGVQGGVNTYDFDSLGSIRVVKSSDSSFFGTGALGGALELRTLDPEDVLDGVDPLGGLSRSTYSGADDSWSVDQALAVRHADTLMLLQGGYKSGHQTDNAGYVGGTGAARTRPDPSDYDQKNFLVKLHQYLPGGHRLSLTGESFTHDEDIDMQTGIDSAYSRYDNREVNKRRRVSAGYDYQPEGENDAIERARALVYWQRVNMQIDTDAQRLTAPAGRYIRDSDLEDESYGLKGDLGLRFATDRLGHETSVGGEIAAEKTTQYAAGQDNCSAVVFACNFLHVNQSDMPDVDGVRLGVFGQDRIGFGDSPYHLTLGLRYDWYERSPRSTPSYTNNAAYEGLPDDSSDAKLSPKVLFEWQVAPAATLYAQWAQSFRAPSATELYLTYGSPGSYVSVGNPDLKPETSNSFEIGTRFGDDALGGRLSIYDNYYRNFIDTQTVTAADAGLSGGYPFGVFAYRNRSHVEIYGAEFDGHWSFAPDWRLWTSLAYAVGKDTDDHVYLNSVPPLKGILGVGYQSEVYGADLSVTAATERDKVEDPSSDLNKTPRYAVFDMTAWWEPALLDGLRLQAGLYNLFNKRHYNALDIPDNATQPQAFYSEPGRYAKVSLRYEF